MPLIAQKVLKPEMLNAAHLAFLADQAILEQKAVGKRAADVTTLDVMQFVLDALVREGVLGE